MNVESRLWKISYHMGNGYLVTQKSTGSSRYAYGGVNESFILTCSEKQFDKYCRELFH